MSSGRFPIFSVLVKVEQTIFQFSLIATSALIYSI